MVLEEAPAPRQAANAVDRPYHLLTLSAKNQLALQTYVRRYVDFLAAHPELDLGHLCYTACQGRSHFAYRLCIAADSVKEIQAQLAAHINDEPTAGILTGVAGQHTPPVAFLFTGQGSQYVGMGGELYATQPTFRRALDECAALLDGQLDRPLLSVVLGTEAESQLLDDTTYTQPALFAIEYALATLWQAWGVRASAVLGHSIGEYAAACVAGVFSLADAVRLVAARGRLMGGLAQDGAMVSLQAEEERVRQALAPYAGEVSLAAVNGPASVVISGRREAVLSISAQLAAEGVKTQRLSVSHAFHSPLMEPMLQAFGEVAASITYHKPTLRLVSNVTGKLAGDEVTRPEYWVRHVRHAVRFADGVATLQAEGAGIMLEIGPKPVLLGMAGQSVAGDREVALLPSLRQGQSEWQQMLSSLGALYVRGVEIDWAGFDGDYERRKLALPTYPFQRQRYWVEAPQQQRTAASVRPLIDKITKLPLHAETVFEAEFSVAALPFLAEHQVYGTVIAPGACQLAMALNAAELSLGENKVLLLEDVVLPQALVLAAEQVRTVQAAFHAGQASVSSAAGSGTKQEFRIVSFCARQEVGVDDRVEAVDNDVATHVTGYAAATTGTTGQPPAAVDLGGLQRRCKREVDVAGFYADSAAAQIELGPSFRWLAEAWQGGENAAPEAPEVPEALARLVRPAAVASLGGYVLHPGLLDACFQVTGVTGAVNGETLLPFALESLQLYRPARGEVWWCHAIQTGRHKWDIQLLDEKGEVVTLIRGFQVRAAPAAAVRGDDIWRQWLYSVTWQALAREQVFGATAVEGERWLILADERGIGVELALRLRQGGAEVVLAHAGEGWRQVDENSVYVAADCAEDYRRLVSSMPDLHGVVHLWSLGDTPELVQGVRHSCDTALLLVQALLQEQVSPAGLWLVTQDAQAAVAGDLVGGVAQSGLWGMGKVIALEHPELNPVCVDLARMDQLAADNNLANNMALAAQLHAEVTSVGPQAMAERQVALRRDARYVARLQRLSAAAGLTGLSMPAGPYRLEVSERGMLDNLQLRPVMRRAPAGGEVEIQVQAGGMNFRDVLNVLGAYPGDPGPIGSECAGVVVAVGEGVRHIAPGDNVLAMTAGSFSRYVTVNSAHVAHRPATLTVVEAAALPTAYLTAYYGLHQLAQMKAGARVLIHAAAGGVGMAAVQLAQQAGAEVYATASPGKWEVLRAMGVSHIYNSLTIVAAQILAETGGCGVDVILNSLTGPGFMEANLAVLAAGGYLAEMSKRNIWSAEQVAGVRADVRYTVFDLGEISVQQPELWQQMLAAVMALLAEGQVKPLPCTVFPLQEAVQAFRLMQQAWMWANICADAASLCGR